MPDFYLGQLDTGVDSALATISGVDSLSFTGEATADINIDLETAKNMFQFYTDSIDITDVVADDIKYKVVYSNSSTPLNIDLDMHAPVSANAIVPGAENLNLTYDYVRYLAQELFSTPNGVDLFSNESALRNTINADFKTEFNTVLLGLATTGIVDADGNSPSETILKQVIHSLNERLTDITGLHVADNWYRAPLEANDKLYFLLTVRPATDQHNATDRATAIANRIYLIRATLTV